eukprot:Blabericola_migrator_1__6073@NODE_3064_length_2067_cov_643_168500_g1915_i0_p2_GENE_NODE_3064_length_2067_cov_643_168500_g1915_i0NODE_3064_length_2067_cov_643_168500_g1915_i0_p2_ORF_typecomplete_len179_score15_94AC_N/PF16214_5/6e02AC_N/PF16214_5/0_076_NODE_3064_length_2067_cov_643_168500_g1915_i014271963
MLMFSNSRVYSTHTQLHTHTPSSHTQNLMNFSTALRLWVLLSIGFVFSLASGLSIRSVASRRDPVLAQGDEGVYKTYVSTWSVDPSVILNSITCGFCLIALTLHVIESHLMCIATGVMTYVAAIGACVCNCCLATYINETKISMFLGWHRGLLIAGAILQPLVLVSATISFGIKNCFS